MLILDIFTENERYDVKQNTHNPHHLWLTLDIPFYSKNWILINLAGLTETMSFFQLAFNKASLSYNHPQCVPKWYIDLMIIVIAWTELKLIYRPISVSLITKIEAMETI